MIHFIKNHPELRKLFGLFLFVFKVVVFTGIFAVSWIFLFDGPSSTPTGDHRQEEKAPEITEKWEKDTNISQQQADTILQDTIQSVEQSHNAANLDTQDSSQNAQRLATICGYYTDICNKTVWDGEFNNTERLLYQGTLIYLLTSLDKSYTDSKNHGTARNRAARMPKPTGRETLSYIKLFNDPEARRGSAGHTYLKLNGERIESRNEFWQVATHEYGHIYDLGVIKGEDTRKDSKFTEFGRKKRAIDDPSLSFYKVSWQSENARKADTSRMDFVSGYAMKGVYEDFAESFNLYMNHYDYFQKLAISNDALQQKLFLLNTWFNNTPLQNGTTKQGTVTDIPSTDKRVWDTTKLKTTQ